MTVTALCPGPTKTEMADAFADLQGADWFLADAKQVAQEGFDALKAGQVIRVPGLANQALVNWTNYQPRWLVRTLGGFAARSAAFFRPTAVAKRAAAGPLLAISATREEGDSQCP